MAKICETIYQEDRKYCQWVLDVDTGNPAVIEFRTSSARDEQWEEQCKNRRELNWRKGKQNRRETTDS